MTSFAATDISTLDRLRRFSIRVGVAFAWVALAILLLVSALGDHGGLTALLVIGCAVNAGPTWMALKGRYDSRARILMGAPAAILPAMMVFLLEGHVWQMDAHMYFFVAMAALAFLGDWRPIAVMTALTGAHHLLLEWLAPAYVFTGSGNVERVAFHVVAVGLQCVLLGTLTVWFERLLNAQDAAVRTAEQLARAAEAEGARARAAMDQAARAGQEAARERQAREAAARRVAQERRGELVVLANEFERSVSCVVTAIADATERLEGSVRHLDDTTDSANVAAREVTDGARIAAADIALVASSIRELSGAIHVIADAAADQSQLTGAATQEARRGVERVVELEDQAGRIEGLVDAIREIAGKTNLLALNATIEAARAGEAGRGFSVVANEVKSLADDTTRASNTISALLVGIRGGIAEAAVNLRGIDGAIDKVASVANGIAIAVDEHRVTADRIDSSADRAMLTAADIGVRIGEVASAADLAATLCGALRGSAADLAGSARELRGSTSQFLSFLHEDEQAAA